MTLPGTPSDEVDGVLATGSGEISTLFVSMARRHPQGRDAEYLRWHTLDHRPLGHADFSPSYVRLLEHGDAQDVGDTMAAGDESTVLARLRRYRDAGVTDLAARVVPLGDDADQRQASRRRTQEFVASLCSEFASRT